MSAKRKAYQQTLVGVKSSGRAFRYIRLKPSEVDQLRRDVAVLAAGETIPDDAKSERRRQLFLEEGIKRMLVAVTKEPVPAPTPQFEDDGKTTKKDADGKDLPPIEADLTSDALWEPLTLQKLTIDGSLDDYFESPDYEHLKLLFSINHEANFVDADSVIKKERIASTG